MKCYWRNWRTKIMMPESVNFFVGNFEAKTSVNRNIKMQLNRSFQSGFSNRRLMSREFRLHEIQIISTYMKIHIWNQDHLIKSCSLDCISAFMLRPDQKLQYQRYESVQMRNLWRLQCTRRESQALPHLNINRLFYNDFYPNFEIQNLLRRFERIHVQDLVIKHMIQGLQVMNIKKKPM